VVRRSNSGGEIAFRSVGFLGQTPADYRCEVALPYGCCEAVPSGLDVFSISKPAVVPDPASPKAEEESRNPEIRPVADDGACGSHRAVDTAVRHHFLEELRHQAISGFDADPVLHGNHRRNACPSQPGSKRTLVGRRGLRAARALTRNKHRQTRQMLDIGHATAECGAAHTVHQPAGFDLFLEKQPRDSLELFVRAASVG
jgi:hypothetical protein